MKKLIIIFIVVLGISTFASSGSSYTNYRIEKSGDLIAASQSVGTIYLECLTEIDRREGIGEETGIDTGSFLEDLQAMKELEERILGDTDKAFFEGSNQELEILREKALEYREDLRR